MEPTRTDDVNVAARDTWIALAYFSAYLLLLFSTLESEFFHWVTLVAIPLAIAWVSRPAGQRTLKAALTTVGLRRGNLTRGVAWALVLGLAISLFQVFFSARSGEIQALISSGRALYLFPLTFVLMMGLAGFTEEFFFRGFLLTRLEPLLKSRWLAVIASSLLFGVYHLPYAYMNPRWPSAGDWGEAWAAALGNGVPGGLLLGTLYVLTGRNLLACVVLHSLINAVPAMTMMRFG
ncbi:MAG: CPBP family intramembrane glutamic endopeptidase [Gemmatimonadota bacterium]